MKTTYSVEGMTCEGCRHKVKSTLEALQGVASAEVDLNNHTATVDTDGSVTLTHMENALQKAGAKYHIRAINPTPHTTVELPEPAWVVYKPLLLIVAFIAGVSALAQYPFAAFDTMLWMRHFMAGFFIVFAFFKLLNLRGFADSYAMYDIIAARWRGWGVVYPFVELALGAAYLVDWNATAVNWATIAVMGVSSIGVIESNLNKRKIKCACLGDVFNLPMSTVTIVEDLGMVAMAVLMLAV